MSPRTLLLNASIPIQKQMQKLHPPYPQTTFAEAEKALETIQSGDILLSREAWHFTNIFIPGYWSHAAIFAWIDGKPVVVEAVAPCVVITPWYDWVLKKHNWCVLRPVGSTPDQGEAAAEYSLMQKGKLYDYGFNTSTETFYCSELSHDAWEVAFPEWAEKTFVKKLTFGEFTVVPEDFYQGALISKLKVICEHRDK